MAKVQFNNVTFAGLENLKVCSESPFSYVEYMLKDLPDGVEAIASPLAFCLPKEMIYLAISSLSSGNVKIVSEGREMLALTKEEGGITTGIDAGKFPTYRDVFERTEKLRKDLLYSLIDEGVLFETLDGTVVSPLAKVGKGTLIRPGSVITGDSVVGENCVIGPFSVINSSKIGNECVINASQINQSVLENDVRIGPFSQIRPNCTVAKGVRIGDFVEVKNSVIGESTHASHLTYIGDSDVGSGVNFGCGTITSNYDGKNKFRTVIGNNVFVGCNTNLVAPVVVGDGSFIAAGSTIVSDVPASSLAIARERQTNKEGWAEERRKKGLLK